MTDAALISVRDLHKRFGRKPVLRGIDLDVAQGEVVALVGANGAGKTTLMRMICGLAKPDRGEISLGGASLQRAGRELRRYIGLVTHAPLLYDSLSAQENLRFFAALYDLNQPEERIESVLRGRTVGAAVTPCAPTAAAWSSASPSPAPCCTARLSSCSTSRTPGSTRAAPRCCTT